MNIKKLHYYLSINTKKSQFAIFTILFSITSLFSFIQFKIQNKEFMIRYDSITEYLTVLAYWGSALRQFFYNLFINHRFIVPQWDFTIGLGADILTTFNWYVIGDPLNLLAVFFSQDKTYYLYNILIFTRLYLCGISFICYCNYKKINYFHSIIGAISYIFCGWIFFCGIRHPYFTTPLIYLPLFYLGIEKLFKNESPILFITTVFLSCITNFYFFYVSTLLIFVYATIRFFFIFEDNKIKNFGIYFSKTSIYYLIGILLAAFILMPNIGYFLSTSRSDMKIPVPLLYEAKYYIIFLFSLISPKMIFSYTFLGFSTLAFITLVVAFTNKNKENRCFLYQFIISMIFICVPLAGHIFNGFNYLTNRWCYAISFIQAFLIVLNIDTIKNLSKKKTLLLSAFSLCVSLGTIALCIISSKFKENFFFSYISLFISILLITPFIYYKKLNKYFNLALTFILIMSVSINANTRYSQNGYNYLEPFIEKNELAKLFNDSPDQIMKNEFSNEKDFYRYEASFKLLKNGAVWFGTHSDAFYWSENSENVMSFFEKLAVVDTSNQSLRGVGNRTPLESLFGIKYLFLLSDINPPFGFEKIKEYIINGKEIILYENKNVLPFCFSFSDFILNEEFSKLDFAERQSALIKYALIESDRNFNSNPIIDDVKKNNFNISFDDNIVLKEESFDVKRSGAKITVTFDKIQNAENYLSLKDFSYNVDHDDAEIVIILNGTKIRSTSLDPKYWLWNHNHLYNLSNHDLFDTNNIIEIVFDKKANYTLTDISVVSYETKNLVEDIAKLTGNITSNLEFSENRISGNLTLKKDQFVCMQLPYSTGWKAFIDGKEVQTYASQIMYTGFFVPKGNHIVELRYSTPYLNLGCILTIFGLILIIALIILRNKGLIK